jgi:hypothetical protein
MTLTITKKLNIRLLAKLVSLIHILRITALAENGRTWWQNLVELCGHVTRGPHKRTLLRPALLFFSFPFSSFRFSFIDNPII